MKWLTYAAVCAASFASGVSIAAEKNIVETAVAAGKFNTLAKTLEAADLVETLKGSGPFTVFAPTDEAFNKLPEGTIANLLKKENKAQLVSILTYHVVAGKVKAADVMKLSGAKSVNGQRIDIKVDGSKVSVDSSNVVTTDIECSNGVIHVIDSVLMPTNDNLPTVASKAGKFATLLKAVKAAGLVDALSGEKPLTVFAPTDDAFAKLDKDLLASLLKPENKEKLASILKYHVVEGRVYSDEAVAAKSAKTLQGGSVKISTKDKSAYVNDAKIIATDVDASNGVIHIIDSVILPPAK